MDKKSINRGKQLKLAREYRGLSQIELVSKVKGLSQSNLSKYEKGFDRVISAEILKEIMSVLKWPLGWLDEPHPTPTILMSTPI